MRSLQFTIPTLKWTSIYPWELELPLPWYFEYHVCKIEISETSHSFFLACKKKKKNVSMVYMFSLSVCVWSWVNV